MIILDLTVLQHGSEVGLKIGNPSPYIEGSAPAAALNPTPAQPQYRPQSAVLQNSSKSNTF